MIRGLNRVRLLVWAGIAATLCAGGGLMAQGQGAAPVQGQPTQPPPPPPINLSDDPLLKPFVWRSIGPANMGGRIGLSGRPLPVTLVQVFAPSVLVQMPLPAPPPLKPHG